MGRAGLLRADRCRERWWGGMSELRDAAPTVAARSAPCLQRPWCCPWFQIRRRPCLAGAATATPPGRAPAPALPPPAPARKTVATGPLQRLFHVRRRRLSILESPPRALTPGGHPEEGGVFFLRGGGEKGSGVTGGGWGEKEQP